MRVHMGSKLTGPGQRKNRHGPVKLKSQKDVGLFTCSCEVQSWCLVVADLCLTVWPDQTHEGPFHHVIGLLGL